jgi:glyoxylase-like metal-dependent hydrolase (beta-lactamase superfamily II)
VTPDIQDFFDDETFTVSYLVSDPGSRRAVVIDPVLDFDPKSARTSTKSADVLLAAIAAKDLTVDWLLETHAHADHLSASAYFKAKLGAKTAIGEQIRDVQKVFRSVFNADDVTGDGAPFDRLLKDGEALEVGGMEVEILYTPGHTPACVSYKIGDNVFVGDTLFMPDYGTARCDFPGGNARMLYRSIRRILSLGDETILWMCHDYKAPGRDAYAWRTTVGQQRKSNIHIRDGVGEDEFVAMRTARDKTLHMPVLILASVQVNIRAGNMPPPENDGNVYLKLPLNRL